MFSIKRVAFMLAGTGAIMVSVHGATILMGLCAGDINCTASVYFGIPQVLEVPIANISSNVSLSSPVITEGNSVGIKDLHAIIQVVGIYALLLGVLVLISLEVAELKILRKSFRNMHRRKAV